MAPGIVFTTLHFLCNLQFGQKDRPLDYTMLEVLASHKYSNLLGLFISYNKMKCCEYGQVSYSQQFIFFKTYILAQ
jgi:hypothetical protein